MEREKVVTWVATKGIEWVERMAEKAAGQKVCKKDPLMDDSAVAMLVVWSVVLLVVCLVDWSVV